MLRWIGYAVVALITIVVATFVLAPAQWMSSLIRSGTGGRVDIAETRGSFWSGDGTLVLASGSAPGSMRASLPERLTWKLSPVALLMGTVVLTLAHPSALAQPLHVRAALNRRVEAGPTTVRLPASLLIGLGAPWNTVRPGGVLSVTWDRLAIEPRRFQGNVTAEWQFASSNLTPVSPFGHYRLLTN